MNRSLSLSYLRFVLHGQRVDFEYVFEAQGPFHGPRLGARRQVLRGRWTGEERKGRRHQSKNKDK
jgi:hypothetical protein